ncbi:MAG TPA: ABC-type transport auxiliary lipoprotein family protein [Thermoanaerobaculia bacterium]|nr:ABC-type transport auxiliary lipoprotein family protein [Thermoanaerobaculia bacterium]
MTRVACRKSAARALLLAATLVLAGCTSKVVIVPQSFMIDPPAPRLGAAPTEGSILSLRPVFIAPVYSGTALVYRLGEHRVESDPYARFGSAPASMLTTAIFGYLRDASFVRDVVVAGESLRTDAVIEPFAGELCGDFSNSSDPVAVITLQFRVLTSGGGTTPVRELLLHTYSQRTHIRERTAAEVVAAWNTGLAAIMKEFLVDLKAVVPPRQPAS